MQRSTYIDIHILYSITVKNESGIIYMCQRPLVLIFHFNLYINMTHAISYDTLRMRSRDN